MIYTANVKKYLEISEMNQFLTAQKLPCIPAGCIFYGPF